MINLTEQIPHFLTYCKYRKELNSKSIKAYTTDLKQFQVNTDNTYSKESICTYLSFLHHQYKPKTIKRKIATLKAFTRYLLIEEMIEHNPFERIDTSFRQPLILPKTIPLNIINDILSSAYNEHSNSNTDYRKWCVKRDIAVLEMLFASGARVSEICNLTASNVDLRNHTIKIFGKGSKERIIQIENPDVLKAITDYYSLFKTDICNSGYFFVNKLHKQLTEQSVRSIICKYTSLSGHSMHITPHMFRHSFATLLLEEDVDIRYIQKMLGHSSITTTQIYTHVTNSKQKEILTTKHPRNKICI